MKHLQIILCAILAIASCDAFVPVSVETAVAASSVGVGEQTTRTNFLAALDRPASAIGEQTTRTKFLDVLDKPYDLNKRTDTRTQLLNDVINKENGLPNPGSLESFASVAPGVWRVVYAPHMTIMAGLFQGELSVQYDLNEDGTIISHARYNFPLFNLYGYLSVSGTYGSVNNILCRVDFDEAWMKTFDDDSFDQGPYPDIASVPNSISKSLIRNIGRSLFIEPFAVFPVSYLDDELIVFDFELLGTRICARKC